MGSGEISSEPALELTSDPTSDPTTDPNTDPTAYPTEDPTSQPPETFINDDGREAWEWGDNETDNITYER